MKLSRVLAWVALGSCMSATAAAEGSAELDLDETPWNGGTGALAHDQNVSASTELRVDVVQGGEKICWRGTGDLTLRQPEGAAELATLPSGGCAQALAAGAHPAQLGVDQVIGAEWDVRVCAGDVSDDACLTQAELERSGRLWSREWFFGEDNTNFRPRFALNGSVYALVPGGAPGRSAVIELHMRGVSGARYVLRANGRGPETSAGL